MKYKAIIVGDDGLNSIGMIRSLGERNIYVDVLITKENGKEIYAKSSKYVRNCFGVEKKAELIVSKLNQMAIGFDKVFVFPTSDFILSVISDNMDKFLKSVVVPYVDEKAVSVKNIMSKTVMAEYARSAGFIIPIMVKYCVSDEYASDILFFEKFKDEYPVIIKSDSINIPGCDFKIVQNENELKNFLGGVKGNTVIVQKYIEDAEEVAIQGVGYGDKKNCDFFGVIHKKRTSVFALGTTTYAELKLFNDEILRKKCCDFADLIGISGIFDLDILIKDNKYYFIECNFRNGSNGYAYTKMGANLPLLWLMYMSENYEEFNKEINKELKNLTFVNDFGDFAHVLKRHINLLKWLYQYFSADVRLTLNIRDIKPFIIEFLNINPINKLFKGK